MAEINLQDLFADDLLSRGFRLDGRVFRREPDVPSGITMSVWLNPENRLKRVRTVTVDCWQGSEPLGNWLYGFDQARAVSEIERGGPWASFEYGEAVTGWPSVIVDDFRRVTLPFIDACSSVEALCALLLESKIPPSNMRRAPLGWVQDVWDISKRAELPEFGSRALDLAARLRLSAQDYADAKWWLESQGLDTDIAHPPQRTVRRLPWRRRSRSGS
nr:hypothetical protein [Sphaerisporangium cinnabarinum]